MVMSKIVFIDSIVNWEYVNKLLKHNQKIKGIFSIRNNSVILSDNYYLPRYFTHATMCAKKFLDNFYGDCEIYFIEILEDSGCMVNISLLLTALQWCLVNDINIINLSIGTTSIKDMPMLYEIVSRLIAKDITIVSACSNSNKMTFPAFFSNVVGVRAIYNKLGTRGFEYYDDMDGIDISCYLDEEIVKYEKKYYSIPCANSFAAPVISANICKLINEGYTELSLIRTQIRNSALSINMQNQMDKEYCEKMPNIPIIELIKEDDIYAKPLIQELLNKFEKCEYYGFCLSEICKTDLKDKIINISHFQSIDTEKILCFYSNYSNIDYVILHRSFDISYNVVNDIDIIINTINNKICYRNERTKEINYKRFKNIEEIFLVIYDILTES